MAAEHRKRYIAGIAALLAAAASILTIFSLLSHTDRKILSLADSLSERFGWQYELLTDNGVKDYEPVFLDEFELSLPSQTQAVRIRRTLTEDIPDAQLEWISFHCGVELFLDDAPLHSDFPQAAREDDGFVRPGNEQWEQLKLGRSPIWRHMYVNLPEDYLGRELTVITYFPERSASREPVYPILCDPEAVAADAVVTSVRYNVTMTLYALLALILAGVFLLDVYNGQGDDRTLLLCLYFLLLFLDETNITYAGYYSVLPEHLDLRFLSTVYTAPLYLYLALRLHSRWKWPLCGLIAVWTAYTGVVSYRMFSSAVAVKVGPAALVVLAALAAAYCAEVAQRIRRDPREKKRLARHALIAAIVAAVYLLDRIRSWGSLGGYLNGAWTTLSMGNYDPLTSLVEGVVSYISVVEMVTEVIRRTMDNRRTVAVLRERSRLTMDSYQRILQAQEATNAAKHEMRHHMTALAGLLEDGDMARAREYVASVTGALERLPTARYSPNILVNAVAGSYLDRAKEEGVAVECSLQIPAELDMADEDLSVFLTNLLENALHACQQIDPSRRRFIRLKMALRENFLFIGCANSAPDEQETAELSMEEKARRQHGYGLEAMRQIAEKYSSMLLVERSAGEFSIKSNFNLRSPKATPSCDPRGQ